jgi:hypothetical protein
MIVRSGETGPSVANNTGAANAANTHDTTSSINTPASQTATPVPSATGNSVSTTVASAGSGTTTGVTGAAKSTTTNTANKPSTGAATLDWTAPTENSDGTVLTNLSGYTVYYGTSPGNMTQSVKITNPGLTAYTMTNLPAGTWYFTITANSADGAESARSGVVSARI